jgi:hypothetical protein
VEITGFIILYLARRGLPLNPTTLERFKSVGRTLVYIVLVIFLIRNVLDIVEQITGSDKEEVEKPAIVSNEVPVTAESVAKVFLTNWYYVGPDDKDNTRISRLEPYVTRELFGYISQNNDLWLEAQESSSILQPQQPAGQQQTQQQTQQQAVQPTQVQVTAKEVDIWQSSWMDQKQGKVKVIARLLSSDNKILFLALPVQQSGTTWQVSALPSLIAMPEGSDKEEEKTEIELGSEEDAIISQLDNFFPIWLDGKSTTVFMSNNKSLPASTWLKDLQAKYEGVQEIEAISQGAQLKIKVVIMIKDSKNIAMLLDYFMTLEKKDGTWKIVSID